MRKASLQSSLVMVLLSLSLGISNADEEPPLPTWDLPPREDQKIEAGQRFSNLLPEGFDQESTSEFYLGLPGGLKSPPLLLQDSEFNSNDLNLFLHGGLLSVPADRVQKTNPTANLSLREVPEGILGAIKTAPRNEYLFDPQSLVTEMAVQDISRLLEFHASEARILLYIVALDHDQKVSDTQPYQELMGRLKSDPQHEVCLALYPMGEPWRTRFLVTQTVSEHASLQGLTDLAEDCIEDALRVSDVEAQLQRFTVRLSTRLFWLEKALPSLNATASTSIPTTIQEVGRLVPAPIPPAQVPTALPVTPWQLHPLVAVGYGVVGVFVAACVWYGVKRMRRKPQRKVAWMLPDEEVQPRLGGAFSGGAGAALQYTAPRA